MTAERPRDAVAYHNVRAALTDEPETVTAIYNKLTGPHQSLSKRERAQRLAVAKKLTKLAREGRAVAYPKDDGSGEYLFSRTP